jgi:hypothetical protein
MKPNVLQNITSEGERGSRRKWKKFHFIGFKVFLRRSLRYLTFERQSTYHNRYARQVSFSWSAGPNDGTMGGSGGFSLILAAANRGYLPGCQSGSCPWWVPVGKGWWVGADPEGCFGGQKFSSNLWNYCKKICSINLLTIHVPKKLPHITKQLNIIFHQVVPPGLAWNRIN